MSIPYILLIKTLAVAIAVIIYLMAVEAVLPANRMSVHYKNVPAFPYSRSQWI